MKNILILHSASDKYGSGKIMLLAIEALQSKGVNCIVCLPESGPLVDDLNKLGCTIIIMELGILRRKYQNMKGFLNRAFALTSSILKLRKIIKKEKIDLIYSNTTAVLSGSLAASLTRKKHIWHIHEIIKSPKIFAKFLAYMIQRFSNKAIAVSTPVKKHWDQLSSRGRTSSVIQIIYNGLPLDDFIISESTLRSELKLNKNTLIIGMVGRVHHWKGQGYFIEIAKYLKKEFDNLAFVMVGDAYPGYEYIYDELNQKIEAYNLSECVYDLGFRTDIPNIMNGFDLFILPSTLPDPLPTVVLESMGLRLPVAATEHGGALEMVENHKTGVHIPWDNAKQAADLIRPILKDEQMRKVYGEKGRERLEKIFSLPSFKHNIVSLVENVSK